MTPPGTTCVICSAPLPPSAGKGRPRLTCPPPAACARTYVRQRATAARRAAGIGPTCRAPQDANRRALILAAVAIYGSQAGAARALGLSRQRVHQVVGEENKTSSTP